MIPIKNQDICGTTEKYILQQCNCLTVTSSGLSETLANHFEHGDVYNDRRPMGRRNCSIPEDRSIPGTVTILDGEEHMPSIMLSSVQERQHPGMDISKITHMKCRIV